MSMSEKEAIEIIKNTPLLRYEGQCGLHSELGDAMRLAVEALEKQIPKKPMEVEEREETDFYYLAFMCPNCGEAVIGQPYRPNNCKHCGQRLDWGE
jgi:predicted RNA-binding Zn-ribbon protein involved in translation (DUF1610 family)